MADPNVNREADPEDSPETEVTPEAIAAAARLIGLDFSAAEREQMVAGLARQREAYWALRSVSLPNAIPPALRFDPRPAPGPAPGLAQPSSALRSADPPPLPATSEELAFMTVGQLAALLRTRAVSSAELTELYLERLQRFDPTLSCVVSLTPELALAQARQADAEIGRGTYRGPLHGIPWGAKDLLATRGIRTTWGATPFQDQVLDYDATVVERLAAAGAVLVAKLTTGALANGDVWFGGITRNPWNLEQGSSGSSAGSAAATAAGLVGFAIGSETLGSIVSPSTRCGVTGLRPTFGRVSRHGAMALSWSMDKLGPICRSVEDAALVFAAIQGPDGRDLSVVEAPFRWPHQVDLGGLRIGYVEQAFAADYAQREHDQRTLRTLAEMGARLVPVSLPDYPFEALRLILYCEAAAAFDELTRSGQDDLLVRQDDEAWPNRFRQARLIPAVEYIQANRVRTLAVQAMARLFADLDLYVSPSFGGQTLPLTNLTGHPAVVLPNGLDAQGVPVSSITFVGRLYDESTLLAAASAYQGATDFDRRRPPLTTDDSGNQER